MELKVRYSAEDGTIQTMWINGDGIKFQLWDSGRFKATLENGSAGEERDLATHDAGISAIMLRHVWSATLFD